METVTEIENVKKLATLIEALTHSGGNALQEDLFKEVKKICKSSESYIPKVYNLLLKQMKKKNSQIRLTAFQMCKELFSRSALFRELLLKDLQLFFELTAETDTTKKLPPPKSTADILKVFAISTLKKWVEEFGETYKSLKVAYNYFKNCKKIDFETLQITNSFQGVASNEQQIHIRTINTERMKKLIDDVNCNEKEICETITSLSNCLNLLLPPPEDFFVANLHETNAVEEVLCQSTERSENDVNENDLRQFGIFKGYNLSLQLNPNDIKIVKTEENSSVIENAKDCVRLINNRFLPMVKKWSQDCIKYSDGTNDEIKRILDLKQKLHDILKKYASLIIERDDSKDDESSDNDDFEEVKKEGYEETINFSEEELIYLSSNKRSEHKLEKDHLNPCSPSDTSKEKCFVEDLPGTSGMSTLISKQCSRKNKLLAVAPKLPFDIDLYHWEDEDLKPPTLLSTKVDVDKFWGSCGSDDIHEIPNPEGVAALRTRVIEFTGTFKPVKWACRAPMPNGKLCPRKDRYKCPFHGKIVARDEFGKCVNPEDEKTAKETVGKHSVPDWQDPQLLSDLKNTTGIDLKMPEKKGKKRKSSLNLTHKKMKTSSAALKIVEAKKLPGLVDVIKKQNNAYTRLSKKIFKRSSLKRVSSALDKLDRNKFCDKFGDQFNY